MTMLRLDNRQHLALHQLTAAGVLLAQLGLVSISIRAGLGPSLTACVYVALHATFNALSAAPLLATWLPGLLKQASKARLERQSLQATPAPGTSRAFPFGADWEPAAAAAVHARPPERESEFEAEHSALAAALPSVLSLHLPLALYLIGPSVIIWRGLDAAPWALGAAVACVLLGAVLACGTGGARAPRAPDSHAAGASQKAQEETAWERSAAYASAEPAAATAEPGTAEPPTATAPKPEPSPTAVAAAHAATEGGGAEAPVYVTQQLGKLLVYGGLSLICASALGRSWPLLLFATFFALDAGGLVMHFAAHVLDS